MKRVAKGIYQHYKGKLYELIDTGIHTETGEHFVIYKALYSGDFPEGTLWLRPLKMFFEEIIVDGCKMPRFRYVSESKI